jgi:hypothetical protein
MSIYRNIEIDGWMSIDRNIEIEHVDPSRSKGIGSIQGHRDLGILRKSVSGFARERCPIGLSWSILPVSAPDR